MGEMPEGLPGKGSSRPLRCLVEGAAGVLLTGPGAVGAGVGGRLVAQLWEFSASVRQGITRGALTCIKAESI